MPGQLVTPPSDVPPTEVAGADHAQEAPRPDVLGSVRRVALVLALGALLGVVGGFVWEWVWTPPTGAAYEGRWLADAEGLPVLAGSTALYVVVGLVCGLVYGAGVALFVRGRELLTLAALVAGSAVMAGVIAWLGPVLGPPDAQEVARTKGDLEPVIGSLSLPGAWDFGFPWILGTSALLAPMFGALAMVIVVWLGGSPHRKGASAEHQL